MRGVFPLYYIELHKEFPKKKIQCNVSISTLNKIPSPHINIYKLVVSKIFIIALRGIFIEQYEGGVRDV